VTYLPDIYKQFTQDQPEIARQFGELAEACLEAGPLSDRERRLVKLGIAVGINSEGGVRSHARRALEEGISAEEVEHVVLLALTTAGFPQMIAAYKWVHEVIDAARRQEPI
jgi:alkylhydroperoxidase/carboxymuconolactone decarboxylase family protein YurZ